MADQSRESSSDVDENVREEEEVGVDDDQKGLDDQHSVEKDDMKEELEGGPRDGYSPIDSPEASENSPPFVSEEEHGDDVVSAENRKRHFDEAENDEETAEKRPRFEDNENEENSQLQNELDELEKRLEEEEGGESKSGPFDDDDDDDDVTQKEGEDTFTNLVDEIDEDEEQEGEGPGEEELSEKYEGEEQTEEDVSGRTEQQEKQNSSDSELEDDGKKTNEGLSDFDVMMQRRKEAMSRARKRRQKDIDISSVDDHISAMLQQMKYTAEEDCRLNLKKKPAVKKLTMLPTVIAQLKKVDLLGVFIESGICSALADWLKPLPDHSLPHLKIREEILDILFTFPELDSHTLKTSGLGKAIMLLYRHPKEVKKNREKAGRLINIWSRPIFGLPSDYKALNRDEREERDWARLSQAAKRRLSSSGGESSQQTQEESDAQKPGDKGWIGRARVPMPSHKDYVVRPKWNVNREIKKGSSKKALNRYERHLQKNRDKQSRSKNTHAVSISVEGRKMPL